MSFIESLIAHPAYVLAAFAMLSALLSAVATFLSAIGKSAPGWLGTVINFIAGATHLLNGNTSAATATVAAPSAPAA